jgi:hypothetical protein
MLAREVLYHLRHFPTLEIKINATGRTSQVTEHLPSIPEALGSIPSTEKKKKDLILAGGGGVCQ